MRGFAGRTGLTGGASQRYLWTDAFAVCNYFELARLSGEDSYERLALELIEQVHSVLGRHRVDDPRRGWISGLGEAEGARHPTRGGLRIGKAFPERAAGAALDERLEWERDGQYYHYLTKWMHTLSRAANVTGDPSFALWGAELATAAHSGFLVRDQANRPLRLFWKMSIDASRPQLASSGHHDPLDGLITVLELENHRAVNLGEARGELELLCRGIDWTTDDTLGLGSLLFDACRLAQLSAHDSGNSDRKGTDHSERLLDIVDASLAGLQNLIHSAALQGPSNQRLAFRELGLAIGLEGIGILAAAVARLPELGERVETLQTFVPLAAEIRAYWLDSNRRNELLWSEHQNINEVMLATSLVPGGFLSL
jgi:hypothetical protein